VPLGENTLNWGDLEAIKYFFRTYYALCAGYACNDIFYVYPHAKTPCADMRDSYGKSLSQGMAPRHRGTQAIDLLLWGGAMRCRKKSSWEFFPQPGEHAC
jgi:hypothetical protein